MCDVRPKPRKKPPGEKFVNCGRRKTSCEQRVFFLRSVVVKGGGGGGGGVGGGKTFRTGEAFLEKVVL